MKLAEELRAIHYPDLKGMYGEAFYQKTIEGIMDEHKSLSRQYRSEPIFASALSPIYDSKDKELLETTNRLRDLDGFTVYFIHGVDADIPVPDSMNYDPRKTVRMVVRW